MSLGHIPLLTRGIFALSYGGENIINELSLGSPGVLVNSVSSIFEFYYLDKLLIYTDFGISVNFGDLLKSKQEGVYS